MGVRIGRGTITVSINDLEMPDEDDDDQASRQISHDVEAAIAGACEKYRTSLSVDDVSLDSWETMDKWTEMRLTASVKVHVRYSPDDGPDPSDWASDYGWNYLAFESQDVDFDWEVVDDDAGEPGSSEVEWNADDEVGDPRDAERERRESERRVYERLYARYRLVQDVVDRVTVHGDTFLDGYLDIDLAHDRANVEDHG